MKTAFVFPGQGAQYVGMALELYEKYNECREVIELASDVLDYDVKHVMFEDKNMLDQTEYTQATLLTACLCMKTYAEMQGYHADMSAGLSLGEYGALVTAGSLSIADALKLVRGRGILMQNAVPIGKGSMAAIINVPSERVESVCMKVYKETGLCVQVSNYNCPGQVVISGETMAVDQVCEELKDEARLVSKLQVSVPSHCELMKDAAEKFQKELVDVTFHKPCIPYICNAEGKKIETEERISELLVKQLYMPVRWEKSVRCMIEEGCDTFIEIGPGNTVNKLIKKINNGVTLINL